MIIKQLTKEETDYLNSTQTCRLCKKRKNKTEFHVFRRRGELQLQRTCKKCSIVASKQWREDNNESFNAGRRENRKNNPEFFRLQEKKYYTELKKEFIKEYGGCCSCCGETNSCFLSLDHKDGKGKAHRLQLYNKNRGGSTHLVLAKLRREGWPKDNYQILCYNCNIAKHQNNNICPHKLEQRRLLNVA